MSMRQRRRDRLVHRLPKAAEEGRLDEVIWLLCEGAPANARDNDGDTALCNAAVKGHSSIVSVLLDFRACANMRCSSGDTALIYAAFFGFPDIVCSLLNGRALVDLTCRSQTPLMYALRGLHRNCATLLLRARASVDVTDNQGFTPLFLAAGRHYGDGNILLRDRRIHINEEQNIRALLEAGSSCNLQVQGKAAKEWATEQSLRSVIEEYELERSVVLTLHTGPRESDGFMSFSCTNLGGDELASGRVYLGQPARLLRDAIASELLSECFRIMLADGSMVDDDEQLLDDVLSREQAGDSD